MKIKLKRGLKAQAPYISEGELVYFTDTRELVTGDACGNAVVLSEVFEADEQLVMSLPDGLYKPLYIK